MQHLCIINKTCTGLITMRGNYFEQIISLEPEKEQEFNLLAINGIELTDPELNYKLIKKVQSLRANVCQIGKRHNKRFSVNIGDSIGVFVVKRIGALS